MKIRNQNLATLPWLLLLTWMLLKKGEGLCNLSLRQASIWFLLIVFISIRLKPTSYYYTVINLVLIIIRAVMNFVWVCVYVCVRVRVRVHVCVRVCVCVLALGSMHAQQEYRHTIMQYQYWSSHQVTIFIYGKNIAWQCQASSAVGVMRDGNQNTFTCGSGTTCKYW